ncbi:glycosyltransferase family 32 protein [Actinomycetes bacterium NPDC127524]
MNKKINEEIPHIIHYCWFGGKSKSKFILNCIDTWKKNLPDYQIIEWNEENFPIHSHNYVREAYEHNKFAFVSDVVRLYALNKHGGIYFDTDIEVKKSIDPYLKSSDVMMAFESKQVIMTGFFAAKKENAFIKKWLKSYDFIRFLNEDGSINVTPNTFRVSEMLKDAGLLLNGERQSLEGGIDVFPKETFGAYDVDNSAYVITSDTVLVHHCKASWMPLKYKIKDYGKRMLAKIIGAKNYNELRMKIKK